MSRRRSAVPASQRGSQAWFSQAVADPAPLLSIAPAAAGAPAGPTAEQQAAAAGRYWERADRYYFASMARLQRLWEVRLALMMAAAAALEGVGVVGRVARSVCVLPLLCLPLPATPPKPKPLQAAKQPHGDLSGAEVEGAVRSVEHLLWLTQRSRATLGVLGDCCRQLGALHAALITLAAATDGPHQGLPPQARCWAWYQQQRYTLAALLQQADETAELLAASAAAETAAVPRKQLQAGAQQAAEAAATLRQCSSRLVAASQGAVTLPASSSDGAAQVPLFLPADVLSALQANAEALHTLRQQEGEQQVTLPGWAELAAAVAAAARDSVAANAALRLGVESAVRQEQEQQSLADHLEAAVAAALVWAQNAKPAEVVAPAGGEGEEQAEPEQSPLPALLQQLEQQLCLHKAAELGSHTAAALAAVAAASNLPPIAAAEEQQRQVAAAAAGLAPLLGLLLCALRQLGLQYLAVHKASAKLCYITASLFAGLVQEGFCMPEGTEGEGREEGREDRRVYSCGSCGLASSHPFCHKVVLSLACQPAFLTSAILASAHRRRGGGGR